MDITPPNCFGRHFWPWMSWKLSNIPLQSADSPLCNGILPRFQLIHGQKWRPKHFWGVLSIYIVWGFYDASCWCCLTPSIYRCFFNFEIEKSQLWRHARTNLRSSTDNHNLRFISGDISKGPNLRFECKSHTPRTGKYWESGWVGGRVGCWKDFSNIWLLLRLQTDQSVVWLVEKKPISLILLSKR